MEFSLNVCLGVANNCVVAIFLDAVVGCRKGTSIPALVLRLVGLASGLAWVGLAPTIAARAYNRLRVAQWLVVPTEVVVRREVILQQQQFSPV